MSLFEQLGPPAGRQDGMRPERMGIALATVTNITDPQKLGRVRCELVTSNEEGKELDWAYVMTPFGGKSYGFYFMPNVGDTVLIAFDDGNIHRPYIIGSLWGSRADPPLKIQEGKNETYQISTPNKNMITLLDKKGEEGITLKTPKGRQVAMNDKDEKIVLTDGDNSITLDGKGGEVLIKCKSKLTITVGSNATISIDGNAGSIKMEGKQSVNIESAQVNVNAKANATIKGGTQTTVESGGMTAVKGGILKLN